MMQYWAPSLVLMAHLCLTLHRNWWWIYVTDVKDITDCTARQIALHALRCSGGSMGNLLQIGHVCLQGFTLHS